MGVLSILQGFFLKRNFKSFSDIFSGNDLVHLFNSAKRIDSEILKCMQIKSKTQTYLSKAITKGENSEELLKHIAILEKITLQEKNLIFEFNATIIQVIRSKLNAFLENRASDEKSALVRKIITSLDECSKKTQGWINTLDMQLSKIYKMSQKTSDSTLLSEFSSLLEQEFLEIVSLQTKIQEILLYDLKNNVEQEQKQETQLAQEAEKQKKATIKDMITVFLKSTAMFVQKNKKTYGKYLIYGAICKYLIIACCILATNSKNISLIWKNTPKTAVVSSSVVSIDAVLPSSSDSIVLDESKKQASAESSNSAKDSIDTVEKIKKIKSDYKTANWKIDWNENYTPDIAAQLDYVFINNDYDPFFGKGLMYIESGGNPTAGSITGALGPFQIIKSTAERYGMDPKLRVFYVPSALTAIKILKDNDGLIFSKRKFLSSLGINLSNSDDINTCRYLFYQLGTGAALDLFNHFDGTIDSLKFETQRALTLNFNNGLKEVDGVSEFMTPREYYVVAKKIFTSVYWSIARYQEIQLAERKQVRPFKT